MRTSLLTSLLSLVVALGAVGIFLVVAAQAAIENLLLKL
jgi:hypothetical protein